MRPAAYVVQRANQIKDVGLADGEARPQGADQLPFGSPPAVGDALYLGFERADRAAADRRSTSTPRRRAAPASTRRTRRCAGRSPRATAAGPRPRCSRTSPAASTTARARSSCSCRERSAIQPLGGHRMHWLRCRIDDRTRHGGAATTYSHPPEIYSITAVPIGALLPSTHAARVEDELLGLSDGTPGQVLPAAPQAGAQAGAGRDARGAGPGVGRLVDVGAARGLRRLDRVRPPLRARPGLGRGRARAGDPRDRRRLDPVRRGAAEGRGAALRALPPRRRPARQRHRRRAVGAAQHDPGRRHGHQPASRRSAASTPRRSSTRASARRWRSARATAPSPPRTSSSSPARRRRASRARSASRPTDGGAVPLHIVPHVYPADRQLPYSELVPDEELMAGGRGVPRRAPPDRHDRAAAAVQVPRPVGRRQPAGLAARRHRARRGGRRARALHVPQPARRRLGRRARAGLGVRARAQPGRALRRRARGRRRRVREDPAHLRDQPGDRRAVAQAGRHAHRARARRADRLRRAHRQGDATGRRERGRATARRTAATSTARSRAPASAR